MQLQFEADARIAEMTIRKWRKNSVKIATINRQGQKLNAMTISTQVAIDAFLDLIPPLFSQKTTTKRGKMLP